MLLGKNKAHQVYTHTEITSTSISKAQANLPKITKVLPKQAQ
jgi:hypothetical protein